VREGFAVTIVVALRRLQETYGERPSTQVAGPSEAVVHTTGKRKKGAEERYEALLRKAFQEAWRVLKPGKYMSVVFGNSSGRIWGLVQRALRDAGFNAAPAHVAILDKGQRSVKGLNSGSDGITDRVWNLVEILAQG
jgi:adenine-specific DNA methylase